MQAAPLSTAAKQAKQAELAKEKRRLPAVMRRQQESRQNADDFAAEYRMLRKVKKGKMSEVRPNFNTERIWLRTGQQEAGEGAYTVAGCSFVSSRKSSFGKGARRFAQQQLPCVRMHIAGGCVTHSAGDGCLAFC